MARIDTLWVCVSTKDTTDGGTNDKIALILNQDDRDAIYLDLPLTNQADLEKGATNLYSLDISDETKFASLESDRLAKTYARLVINGRDMWNPGQTLVWGVSKDGTVYPIAFNQIGMNQILSEDSGEGRVSSPILPAYTFWSPGVSALRAEFDLLMIAVLTGDGDNDGTDDTITLEITGAVPTASLTIALDTKDKSDFQSSQASFYNVNPGKSIGLTLHSISLSTIKLKTNGSNQWKPASFFLFGCNSIPGSSSMILSALVSVPDWKASGLGWLSSGTDEGADEVTLPLVKYS